MCPLGAVLTACFSLEARHIYSHGVHAARGKLHGVSGPQKASRLLGQFGEMDGAWKPRPELKIERLTKQSIKDEPRFKKPPTRTFLTSCCNCKFLFRSWEKTRLWPQAATVGVYYGEYA